MTWFRIGEGIGNYSVYVKTTNLESFMQKLHLIQKFKKRENSASLQKMCKFAVRAKKKRNLDFWRSGLEFQVSTPCSEINLKNKLSTFTWVSVHELNLPTQQQQQRREVIKLRERCLLSLMMFKRRLSVCLSLTRCRMRCCSERISAQGRWPPKPFWARCNPAGNQWRGLLLHLAR